MYVSKSKDCRLINFGHLMAPKQIQIPSQVSTIVTENWVFTLLWDKLTFRSENATFVNSW